MLRKARTAAPITDAQIRLALGFMREIEPDPQELDAFRCAITSFSSRKRACFICTDITKRDEEYKASSLDLYLPQAHHHFIHSLMR